MEFLQSRSFLSDLGLSRCHFAGNQLFAHPVNESVQGPCELAISIVAQCSVPCHALDLSDQVEGCLIAGFQLRTEDHISGSAGFSVGSFLGWYMFTPCFLHRTCMGEWYIKVFYHRLGTPKQSGNRMSKSFFARFLPGHLLLRRNQNQRLIRLVGSS